MYKTQVKNLERLFDKKKLIEWHCYKCDRLLFFYGNPASAFGTTYQICKNSRCKARHDLLLFEKKCYLINNQLAKKQKMLLRFRDVLQKNNLPAKEYSVILNLIK